MGAMFFKILQAFDIRKIETSNKILFHLIIKLFIFVHHVRRLVNPREFVTGYKTNF